MDEIKIDNALTCHVIRSYLEPDANEYVINYVSQVHQDSLLREFKKNKKLQKRFMSFLIENENASIMDAWNCILYDAGENAYISSIERERSLRKKCNVYDEKDELPIDISYSIVVW